jgi:acetyltransferase-like isoleucine patch superfamily enzyme
MKIKIRNLIRRFYFFLNFLLNWSNISYGKNIQIFGLLNIKNKGKISIGDNVIFNSSYYVNPITSAHKISIRVNRKGVLVIGKGSKISNCSIIVDDSTISIGDYVHIGSNSNLYATDFHSLDPALRMRSVEDSTNVNRGPISIGNHVFIAANVGILKNVKIGDYSIIGYGSVVTKDVPPFEIWGGVPAKKIRAILPEEINTNTYAKKNN